MDCRSFDSWQRPRHLEEELDQCWDLLRQRRACRSSAAIPIRPTRGRSARSRITCSDRARRAPYPAGPPRTTSPFVR
ncbi:MAG: DUF2630 family protein [Actinoallomurus sp.]